MIYILPIGNDDVILGGQVATTEMIEMGWIEYHGDIPSGTSFKYINGVLESYTPVKSELQLYTEYMDYLISTDHKFYGDYELKENEDLDAIRAQRKIARDFIRSMPPHIPTTGVIL